MFCLQNRLLGGQRPRASLRLEQPCLPRASGSFLSPASGFFKPLPVGTQVLWVSRTLRAPEPGQGHPDTAWGPLPAGAQRGCGPPPSPCGELGQDSESSEQACRSLLKTDLLGPLNLRVFLVFPLSLPPSLSPLLPGQNSPKGLLACQIFGEYSLKWQVVYPKTCFPASLSFK